MHNLENKIAVNSRVPTARLSDGNGTSMVSWAFLYHLLPPAGSKPCSQACVFRLWSIAVSPLQSRIQVSRTRDRAPANSASEPGSFTGKNFLLLASEEFLLFCQLSRTLYSPSLPFFISLCNVPEMVSLNVHFTVLYIRFSNHSL